MVYRIFVEKKPGLDNEAQALLNEARNLLGIQGLNKVRLLNRYDAEEISEELFRYAVRTVFSEPQLDLVSEEADLGDAAVFAVEYLPGQFDQRADSAAQCIQILSRGERPLVRSAKVYALYGTLTDAELAEIKKYVINPVEAREAALEKPETLRVRYEIPTEVATLSGFCTLDRPALEEFVRKYGLAMDADDIAFCQRYFRDEEKRDPTITEVRVLDTYWSDHCRHTTFSTELCNVEFEDGYYRDIIEPTYLSYLDTREELYKGRKDKYVCLMDLAIMGMKKLKADGKLTDQEESDENNACSVVVPVEVDYGKGPETEEWLVFFKNETHNHPTEIEPFGGAATCLGGAIRDPLRDNGEQASPEKARSGSRKGVLQLRKPDRPCHRPCQGDLSPRLCCKAHGDRRCHGRCGAQERKARKQ